MYLCIYYGMEKKYVKIGLISIIILSGIGIWLGRQDNAVSAQVKYLLKEGVVPSLYSGNTDSNLQTAFFPVLTNIMDESEDASWDRVAIAAPVDTRDVFSDESSQASAEEVIEDQNPATSSDAIMETINTEPLSVPHAITYSMEQLQNFNFLVQNCYIIDSSTNVAAEELSADSLLKEDFHIDTSSGDYKVLIYHTHGSEAFSDSRPGVTEDTVIGVGDELTRILEDDYGIPVYHDRTVYDVVDGVEDRSQAYDYASDGIDAILEQYPSIEVVLDIHRDGVRDEVRLVREIDGLPTAQIMFLNGMSRTNENGEIDYLYNPYRQDNLAFSLQMHLAGKAMYGDLMRRIYVRGYCFNLDKKARSSLIEVGAQTNTVAEAKNAMVPLGAILYKVLIAQE